MRIVVRVYKDEKTKTHHDEYKTDCADYTEMHITKADVDDFIERTFWELKEEEVDDDSSNEPTGL